MANKEQRSFIHRIRGNAEWEAVKWVWAAGRSAVISGAFWIIQKIRHVQVDWIGIGILFTLLMVLGYLMRRKKQDDPEQLEIVANPPWTGYASEEAWRDAVASQNRLIELGRSVDGLFTPLQIESFRLAKELRALADRGRTGCTSSDFHLLKLEYEQKFAPKVKDMMFAFAHEQGGEDSMLRQHVQYINNGNDVLNIANALIRLAHIQDGIDIELRYPL